MKQVVWVLIVAMGLMVGGCGAAQRGGRGDGGEPVLRHVVLFAWKADTPEDKLREIESAFAALPGKIDTIRDFEWGTDVSTENRSEGYTHCFLVTFADQAGLEVYGPHPAHQEFVTLIRPHMEKVLVIDYWATR